MKLFVAIMTIPMKLQDYLTPNTTALECYLCPVGELLGPVVQCGWETLPPFPFKQLSVRNDYDLVEYSHRNLLYQYDLTTDMQKNLQVGWEKDCFIEGTPLYCVALHEDVLPNHRFPSTQEMTNKRVFHRVSYRWNSRIFVNLEKEDNCYTTYIRYNHTANVDLDKMNEDFSRLLHLFQGNPVLESRV
jgi:hypothetical protein